MMSDDSFIREVNEEMRQDQAQAAVGPLSARLSWSLAVLVVLGTAAFVGYEYWDESRANRSGDAFSQALKLANDGKNDEALAALTSWKRTATAPIRCSPACARRPCWPTRATSPAPSRSFDEVAADTSIPAAIRDMARLRAGLHPGRQRLLCRCLGRVEALTADTNPLRHSAREALGLSAWKEGKPRTR